MERRRRRNEAPIECACGRILVAVILPGGEMATRCRACAKAVLTPAEALTPSGVPVYVVSAPARTDNEPPPCPRCCEPLGLLDPGFCSACGYPGAVPTPRQLRRALRLRRRRLDGVRVAS